MITPLPLIREVTPVIPGMPARGRPPNIGVVYATSSGRLGFFDDWRPMTYREQLTTQYRRRYDVDMSEHRRGAKLATTPLPARGDYLFFTAEVEVVFQVHDPEEIVRRNVTDAMSVVYGHLIDECRQITHKHEIEDAKRAEEEINARFNGDDVLSVGITVRSVMARLQPDARSIRYLAEKKEAERRLQSGRAEHLAELEMAQQRGELYRLHKQLERDTVDAEFARMKDRELNALEIVRHHLARHPEDTEGALELMVKHRKAWMEHQEQYNKRTAELFQSMVDSKLVQAADMEKLLPQMLGQLGVIPPVVPVEPTTGPGWEEPPVFAPAQQPPDAVGPPAKVQPVYLVLDESGQAEEMLPHLRLQLSNVFAALASSASAPGLRLAVLSYARHVSVRVPLGEVRADIELPELGKDEPVAYTAMLGDLRDRLDADLAVAADGVPMRNPLVYLLCVSIPEDDWTGARERLTDPALQTRPPEIVVFGVGDAPGELVRGLATGADEAFAAEPGMAPASAMRNFAEFVVSDILSRAERADADRTGPAVPPPPGFSAVEAP